MVDSRFKFVHERGSITVNAELKQFLLEVHCINHVSIHFCLKHLIELYSRFIILPCPALFHCR